MFWPLFLHCFSLCLHRHLGISQCQPWERTAFEPTLVFFVWAYGKDGKSVTVVTPRGVEDGDMQVTSMCRCAPTEVLFQAIRNLTIHFKDIGIASSYEGVMTYWDCQHLSRSAHTACFLAISKEESRNRGTNLMHSISQNYRPATALYWYAGGCFEVCFWSKWRVLCNELKKEICMPYVEFKVLQCPTPPMLFLFLSPSPGNCSVLPLYILYSTLTSVYVHSNPSLLAFQLPSAL